MCIGAAPKWDTISLRSGRTLAVRCQEDLRLEIRQPYSISVNRQGKFKEPSNLSINEEDVLIVEEPGLVGGEKNDEVLVRAYPQSGRTHQIRLHSQYLGISIRGDVKYEGVCEWNGKVYDGHELHAETLTFDHPITGLMVEFRAPLPSWATQAIQIEELQCEGTATH